MENVVFRKGFRLATALKRKNQPSSETEFRDLPNEHEDNSLAAAATMARPPYPLTGLPDYQSYMPLIVFLPPPIRGQNRVLAEEVRHQFLQESLYTAERWHERIEEIHLQGRIDLQKRDDFHEHIAIVLDDLRNKMDADFWLSIQGRQKNKYTHELIRDYLRENSGNRPRERRSTASSPEALYGEKSDFFIPADDFLFQGCTLESGTIVSHLEITGDYIIYGPYRPYPIGLYEVSFDLKYDTKVAVPGLNLTVDITQGGKILASSSRDSLSMAYKGGPESLKFTNSDPGALTEFRVHVDGIVAGAKITFKGVRMFKT